MSSFLRQATEKQEEIIRLIRSLVECESPSHDPAGTGRVNELLVEATRDIAVPTRLDGGHLRLEFRLGALNEASQILALGHSDTVWERGTISKMPFHRDSERLWGPGVLDMKAGITFFIFAMRILVESGADVPNRVVLLVVSDEEVGSHTSRHITEAEAAQSKFVLVLEPGTGLTGKLKTARKGVGGYHLNVSGRAAHAGVDFENGASAILEAARQIERIAGFTNLSQGTTVNPGVISGGTRSNVVAAEADVYFDVRVAQLQHADALAEKFRKLEPFDKRCKLNVEGGLNRPPMERTQAIADLFAKARTLGSEMGVNVEESSTGGASDGNFTAALGIPTLDGLGAVGEGAHAANESILIDRIADRVALLAGLVAHS